MSEKNAFIANQKNFISRNFTNFTQSLFTHKNFFCTCLSSLSEKISIYTNQKLLKAYEPPSKAALLHTKALHFCTSLFSLSAKISHFYKPKAFLSHKPFLLPSKATLFCPPSPLPTTLNLLFAKNTAVLLISALNPCAVKPEPRTDSNHCRRYPENCGFLPCRLPDERRLFSQKHRIDRRFESRSQDGVPRAFWLLFARCKK